MAKHHPIHDVPRIASKVEERTKGLVAWNWQAFPKDLRPIKSRRGRWGTSYTFKDDSKGFVPYGSARLFDRTLYGQSKGIY